MCRSNNYWHKVSIIWSRTGIGYYCTHGSDLPVKCWNNYFFGRSWLQHPFLVSKIVNKLSLQFFSINCILFSFLAFFSFVKLCPHIKLYPYVKIGATHIGSCLLKFFSNFPYIGEVLNSTHMSSFVLLTLVPLYSTFHI
jgi:hypothetical protein